MQLIRPIGYNKNLSGSSKKSKKEGRLMNGNRLQKNIRFFLAAVLFLSAVSLLQAFPRINITMVDDIQRGDLIVFGDISQGDGVLFKDAKDVDSNRFFIAPVLAIKILEVLKGDASLVGETIPWFYDGDFHGPNIKIGQQIVIFVKDAKNGWGVLEGYKDESIPILRCLMDILQTTPETAKAQKLMDLIQNPNYVYIQPQMGILQTTPETDQWRKLISLTPIPDYVKSHWTDAGFHVAQSLDILDTLRDKDSFSIVEKALPNALPEFQRYILEWMEKTGDLRAVPVFLRYIDSQDSALRREAVSSLISYFAGAPGITEAFLDKWRTSPDDVRRPMVEYLSKRVSDPDIDKARNAYQEQIDKALQEEFREHFGVDRFFRDNMEKAFRDGPKAEAKKYCIQIVEDVSLSDFFRTRYADCVATSLNPAEQNKYIPILAGYLEEQVENGEPSWYANGVLRAALSAQHPALLRTLILSIKRLKDISANHDELLSVILAIRGYGKDASEMAVKELLTQIDKVSSQESKESSWLLIALALVGTDQDLSAMRQILGNGRAAIGFSNKEYRQLAASLKPVSEIPDEAAFWIEMIKNRSNFPDDAVEWFAARLGQLRDKRAIPVLMEIIWDDDKAITAYGFQSGGITLEPVYSALAKMGKPGIEQLKSFVVKRPDVKPYLTGYAIHALCNSEKEALLPFLRQMIKTGTTNGIYQLWACIGQYGTVKDIAFLAPYTDYWKYSEGSKYGNPRQAISQLRRKYGYDVSGRIQKHK